MSTTFRQNLSFTMSITTFPSDNSLEMCITVSTIRFASLRSTQHPISTTLEVPCHQTMFLWFESPFPLSYCYSNLQNSLVVSHFQFRIVYKLYLATLSPQVSISIREILRVQTIFHFAGSGKSSAFGGRSRDCSAVCSSRPTV